MSDRIPDDAPIVTTIAGLRELWKERLATEESEGKQLIPNADFFSWLATRAGDERIKLVDMSPPKPRRHRSDVICKEFLCLPEVHPGHYDWAIGNEKAARPHLTT